MRIGFDLHGILTDFPHVFRPLLKGLVEAGIKVYILSGPPEEQIKRELLELGYLRGVHYEHALSVINYLQDFQDVKTWQDENGNWWADDTDWWNAKGNIARSYRLDLVVDDSPQYGENMPPATAFALIKNLKMLSKE